VPRRRSKLFFSLLFLAGLALFGAMVWHVGLAGLRESFQALGPWIVPYILLQAVPIVLHSAAWGACFPGHRLPLKLWQLVLIGRAGSAINQIIPTATIGGEVVKVLLLESTVSREQAMAMVVIDKASSAIAKMFYLAFGTMYLVQRLPLPLELQVSLGLALGLISLGLIGFVVFQRYGLLSRLVQGLERFRLGQKRLPQLHHYLMPLDAQLVTYYTRHPWRYVRSLLLHFTAHTCRIMQTYILLRLLLGHSAPGFAEALMVAVVVGALDQVFFFVPGRIGTLEGARFVVLTALGVAHVYGLAFGLVARVEQLVWKSFGLLAYAVCLRLAPPEAVRTPPPVPSTSS
jgi:Lysylphosphatidylglycerol synthase TM region